MANSFKDILRQHAAGAPPAKAVPVVKIVPEPVRAAEPVPQAPAMDANAEALKSLRQENADMAAECIAAGLVTAAQAEKVGQKLKALHAAGELARFDDVAMQMGYYNRVQVAELQEELRSRALLKDRYVPSPKIYNRQSKEDIEGVMIGSRMIAAGIITAIQRDRIIERQQKLIIQGAQIRFGELAVQLGYCTEPDLRTLIEDILLRKNNQSW